MINSTKNPYMIRMYKCISDDLSRYRFHLTRQCYSKNENEFFLRNVGVIHGDILRAIKSRNAGWAKEEMPMISSLCWEPYRGYFFKGRSGRHYGFASEGEGSGSDRGRRWDRTGRRGRVLKEGRFWQSVDGRKRDLRHLLPR